MLSASLATPLLIDICFHSNISAALHIKHLVTRLRAFVSGVGNFSIAGLR